MAAEDGEGLHIVVVTDSGPHRTEERAVVLSPGACLGDALRAVGLQPDVDAGIWGRARPAGSLLADGDRVEVYRPLRVDPKVARRERFRSQGARATGLFAKKP